MRNNRMLLLFLLLLGILVSWEPKNVAAAESSDSENGVSIQVDRLEGNSKGQSATLDVSDLFGTKDTERIETYTEQDKLDEQKQVNALFTTGVEETTHETFNKKSLFTAPINTNHTGESVLQQETHALGSVSLLENTWFKFFLIAVSATSVAASYQLYKRDNYEG